MKHLHGETPQESKKRNEKVCKRAKTTTEMYILASRALVSLVESKHSVLCYGRIKDVLSHLNPYELHQMNILINIIL